MGVFFTGNTLDETSVTGIAVTNGGTGYTSIPTVSISGGGGSGARATATTTGIVNNLTITNPGSGYTAAPTVVFTGGGGGTGAAAVATLTRTSSMESKAIQELFELDYGGLKIDPLPNPLHRSGQSVRVSPWSDGMAAGQDAQWASGSAIFRYSCTG